MNQPRPLRPVHGITVPRFRVQITERQPFDRDPVVSGLSRRRGGDASVHPQRSGRDFDVVPSAKRFALDTESTVITVGGVKRRPSASNGSSTCETNSNPLRDGYGLSWTRDAALRRTSDRSPARSILSRDTRNGSRTRSSWRVIRHHRSLPRRFAFARLWRAVFPTVVALAFVAVGVGGIAL